MYTATLGNVFNEAGQVLWEAWGGPNSRHAPYAIIYKPPGPGAV